MNSSFLVYDFMNTGYSKNKSTKYYMYVSELKRALTKKFLIFLRVQTLLFSSMSNWLNNELKKKNDEAKRKVRHLDKNHMKDFKNVRNRICSRIDNIDKMRRKLRGNKQTEVKTKILNFTPISCDI